MAKYKLDALVAPTARPAWPTDLANGDHSGGGGFTGPAPSPAIRTSPFQRATSSACPSEFRSSAKAYSEPVLIRLAFAYEQATKFRKPPRFLPSVDLSTRHLTTPSPPLHLY